VTRAAIRTVLLAAAFALATRALGWWAVPLVGAAWTLLSRGATRAPWDAALAAIVGWSAIFVFAALTSPLTELARRMAGIFGQPPLALYGITLLYGALLAWGGAGVALVVPFRSKTN
jgi:hypothetical protein